jgi:hypothetical protein
MMGMYKALRAEMNRIMRTPQPHVARTWSLLRMFSKKLRPDDVLRCRCGCAQAGILIDCTGAMWTMWWGTPGKEWAKIETDAGDIRTMCNHPDPEQVRVQFTIDALEGRLDA